MERFLAEEPWRQPWSSFNRSTDAGAGSLSKATASRIPTSQTPASFVDSSIAATNGPAKPEIAGEIKTRQTGSDLNSDSNWAHEHSNDTVQHNGKRNHTSNGRSNGTNSHPSTPLARRFSDCPRSQQHHRPEGSTNHDLLYIGSMFVDDKAPDEKSSRSERRRNKGDKLQI
jgi:hypothetical protein